ncbi:MAG: outer membrane beta-barrel protein [Polyangiaceae bacterium]|nr:outer membrane beta-barrel protein [Polyangiaceae bacterium]
MRRWFASVSFLIPLTVCASAYAEDNCPPGSWFCENVEVQTGDDEDGDDAAPAKDRAVDDDLATSPDDLPESSAPKRKRRVEVQDRDVEVEADGDTVVVVKKKRSKHRRRNKDVVVVRETEEAAATPQTRRKKKERRWREHFGLNLRLEGAAFAGRYDTAVGMGGAGASFRWRPSPYFAFDLGADIIGGTDYNGDDRVEFAGALSGLLYFNPQHRVQVYGIGGIHLSHAEIDSPSAYRYDDGYYDWSADTVERNYFGGHGGLGIEFRIARHFAMFVDAMALIRTRIDSDQAEFYNPNTGEASNTSGAGLFRTGVTFWW